MKRAFSTMILAAVLGLALMVGACGDDDNPADGGSGIGSVSGKITFTGSWPLTGEVQVAIYSSLTPPAYTPTGPPDAFSNPITPGLTEYNYELTGLDPGTYAGILVSWREPSNPSGARMLGMYWIHGDSLAVFDSGLLKGTAKDPGPKPVTINEANPSYTGLDFTADLNITAP